MNTVKKISCGTLHLFDTLIIHQDKAKKEIMVNLVMVLIYKPQSPHPSQSSPKKYSPLNQKKHWNQLLGSDKQI